MLSCKDVTQLVSESLDGKLSLRRRLTVRLHLLMCKFCSRFRRQMLFLSRVARDERLAEETEPHRPGEGLSPDARSRLKQLLKDRAR